MTTFQQPAGSGKWRAKFEYQGKQVWVKGGPFPSEAAAEAAEDLARERLKRMRSDETVASFGERWLAEWPRPATSTRKLYADAVARFTEAFGTLLLAEPERHDVRAWALGVPRNISKIIGTMYEDARNVGLVDDNPAANLRLPATEKTAEVAPPTLEEYHELLNACTVLGGHAGEFRALVQFTAWTGLRSGEVQALRWEDVGEDTVRVHATRGNRKTDGSYGSPKNGKGRVIELLEPARVLDQVPRLEGPGSEFVFHTPRGEVLKKGNLHYIWNRVRDTSGTSRDRIAAGIKPIRFHDLRHFCATQLLELGADHFAVSVQLGHEDGGALVMARYGHPSKDAARGRLRGLFDVGETDIRRSTTGQAVG